MLRMLTLCAPLALVASPVWAGPVEDCNQNNDLRLKARGCTEFLRLNSGGSKTSANKRKQVATAYALRGDAYRRLGRRDLAIQDYAKAIELEPRNPDRYIARGEELALQGDFASARADFDKAEELDPKGV